jgi:hypothetical protein
VEVHGGKVKFPKKKKKEKRGKLEGKKCKKIIIIIRGVTCQLGTLHVTKWGS